MIVGLGADLVDCSRIERIIQEYGDRFLKKTFTEKERLYAASRKDRSYLTYGLTFAGKEAVLKALVQVQGIGWHDIEVVRSPSGQPQVNLYNIALKHFNDLVSHKGVIHITLTDERPYAQAFVIIESL